MNRKVVVLCLDGATWNLIRPWTKEGELPTFKKLMEDGAWGELEAPIPPCTPVSCTCFLTGKNPGKTGIFEFYKKKENSSDIFYISGANIPGRTLLDILSEAGIKIGSIFFPYAYRMREINGFIIAGLEIPPGRSYTYPERLQNELDSLGYKIMVFQYKPGKEYEFIIQTNKEINMSKRVLFYLMDKWDWDFLLIMFKLIDSVSHLFWKFMMQNHSQYNEKMAEYYGDAILNVYKRADSLLGSILKRTTDETTLILFSDHGSGPVEKEFNLNLWLAQNKYIIFTDNLIVKIKKILNNIITPKTSWKFISMLLPLQTRSMKSGKVKGTLLQKGGSKLFLSFDDIDWERTSLYALPCMNRYIPLYINRKDRESKEGIVEKESEDHLIKNFVTKLLATTNGNRDNKTNEKVVKAVHRTTSLYNGELLGIAPDLLVELQEKYIGKTRMYPIFPEGNKLLFKPTWSGGHDINGIFLAYGKEIRKSKVRKIKIWDIAPTILHIFNLPIPRNMDGVVLKELFKDDSNLKRRSVIYESLEKERIKRKIRELKKKSWI